MANTNGPQVTAARQIAALDEVDQRLLDELVADGRLSMRALAERVHISRAGCYTRVERLQRDGIITGYTAIVDARRLGRTLLAHVYSKGPPGTARTMRRMEKITGRTDDMIILRSVNLFPAQIEDLILGIPAFVGPFQCLLTGNGPLDELTVRVERRPDADVCTGYGASSELRALIKNLMGVSVHVDVVEPDQTERSVGKMQRVIDERKHR